MKLTRKHREWLKDIKKRAKRDYQMALMHRTRFENDGLTDDGYKNWESWRLADLCEKLGGVKCKP